MAPRRWVRSRRDLELRRDRGRDLVDPVRREEVPVRPAVEVRVAVLPDDPIRPRVDDEHPMAEVVVHGDEPARQVDGETRMIQAPRSRSRCVAPQDVPVPIESDDGARVGVVDDEDVAVGVEVGVRRVPRRDVDVEDDVSGFVEPDDP